MSCACVRQVLDDAGLTLDDIDVFEIHEAFAGQVLSNLAAMDSNDFAQKSMGRNAKVRAIPMTVKTAVVSCPFQAPTPARRAKIHKKMISPLKREDSPNKHQSPRGRLALDAVFMSFRLRQ